MPLQKQIDEDLRNAMRSRDTARLSVLRLVKTALRNAAIEKMSGQGELDDAEAVAVIRKQVKQRQDSVESFEKGGRPELAEKEKAEISILNDYLQRGLEPEELRRVVAETISETGATSRAQMGIVMKALQAKLGGRADGKTLSAEVQAQLAS